MIRIIGSLFLVITLFSCSQPEQVSVNSTPPKPSSFEQIKAEIYFLLPLLINNNLVIDSTKIDTYLNTYALKKRESIYRSDKIFDSITLKRVFQCKNEIINTLHFDFYYDTTYTKIKADSDSIVALFTKELGEKITFYTDSSITTYSWLQFNNIIDLEVFKSGYTITIRKNKAKTTVIQKKKNRAKHFKYSQQLLHYLVTDSIQLNQTTKAEIRALFAENYTEKPNSLVFNKTFDKQVLLSASFVFKEDILNALYFDYVYKDTTTSVLLSDSKIVRLQIIKLFNNPSDVAMVPLSTSYTWHNIPLKLEIYTDGFSVILEEKQEL